MSTEHPTYVYGVLAAPVSEATGRGIGGAPIRAVTSDGIAALVSELPEEELTFGREEMTTHARVLEAVLERGTVLPMRFGVVMADAEAVRHDLLEAHRDELRRQLTELQGKVELRVRAVYEEQPLMREVLAEDPQLAHQRDQLRNMPPAAAHFQQIQLGERVARAVEAKRELDAQQILDALSPLALTAAVSDPNHERVVLSASFLVDVEQLENFDAAVDQIGRAQADRMRFRYTGPLPPHSFVELHAEA